MKKHLLTSTLLISLATASVAAISSCASVQTSQEIEDNSKQDKVEDVPKQTNPKTKDERVLNSSCAIVKFAKNPDGGQDDVTFIGATASKAIVGKPFATVKQPTARNGEGYYADYWKYAEDVGEQHKKGDRVRNTDIITDNFSVYPFFESDVQVSNCVGIAAINDSTVSLVNHGDNAPNIDYSLDGISWSDYTGSTIQLKAGKTAYFKGSNDQGFSHSAASYTSFQIGGAVNINGKIMSLIDDGQASKIDIDHDYCFYGLFSGCAGIVSISSKFFPNGALSRYCYAYLFRDCVGLTDFPSELLPVTSLSKYDSEGELVYDGSMCYLGMFMNCDGLTTLPDNLLPAENLSTYCYRAMFNGCDGLIKLPTGLLSSADELTYGCYYGMFSECHNLKQIGDSTTELFLPATILAEQCYMGLFANCDKLVDAPTNLLTAVTDLSKKDDQGNYLYTSCYNQMFYGCEILKTAPSLPAENLCPECYEMMFYNCYALQTPPALNAQTMVTDCYRYMFYNCGLTTIPELNATVLAPYCYSEMFRGCTNLGDLSSSDLPAQQAAKYCYYRMFADCTGISDAPSIAFVDTAAGQTNLAESCCEEMFMSCTNLGASPELLSVHTAKKCYYNMFEDCSSLTVVGYIHVGDGNVGLNGWSEKCCAYMFNGCSSLGAYVVDSRDDYTFIRTRFETEEDTNKYAERMFQETAHWATSGGPLNMGTYWWHYGDYPEP